MIDQNSQSALSKLIGLVGYDPKKEAADEFLDNDEYRDAKERNRGGIRTDMENVARLLRLEGTEKA